MVKAMVEVGGRELLLMLANGFTWLCIAERVGNKKIVKVLEKAYQQVGLSAHEIATFKKDPSLLSAEEKTLVERLKTRVSKHVVTNPAVVQGAASGEASGSFPAAGSMAAGGRIHSENRCHTAIPQLTDTMTALVMGTMVRVHLLQSAPEHNGVLGEIVNHNAVKG